MENFLRYITGYTDASHRGPISSRMHKEYMITVLLASLPCIALSVYAWGSRSLLVFLAAFLPGLLIEYLFSLLRKRTIQGGAMVFSLLLVLLLPATTPVWLVILASAFGNFFGKEIFGGSGYQLVSPVLLAKFFLMIAYLPQIQGPFFASAMNSAHPGLWKITGGMMLIPVIPLLILQRSNRFILAGLAVGAALMILWMRLIDIMPYDTLTETLVLDSFAFVCCFILFDPATAPVSHLARVLYGFIVAVLAFLIAAFSNKYTEGIIIAALFGNILSPLLDLLFKDTQPKPE